MKKMRQTALVAVAISLMAAASIARAVPLSINSANLSPDDGYGQDPCEKCGIFLDVRFSTAGFTAQTFALDAVGASRTFNIGTVNLQEPNSHGGIDDQETDLLGVRSTLTFTGPGGSSSSLTLFGTGTAVTGPVADSAVDYTLAWKPLLINLGSQGQLEIAFNDLALSGAGPAMQTATITLREPGSPVPEPGTMALFGLGLAGLGWVRRRKSA